MKYTWKDVIWFLFPELQVVEAIKKYGFVARHNKSNNQMHAESVSPAYARHGTHTENIAGTVRNTAQHINANKINTRSYKQKDNIRVNTGNISEAFDSIREQLGTSIIGQSNYLDSLCMAFKRPFVTGYEGEKPKNVIFVLGNKGTGKHRSITLLAGLLKQKKLASTDRISRLDLSLYATAADYNVFLSDLYKSLYGQSDIVVFDNFEKSHATVIDVIQSLTAAGKYTLSTRYVLQNNVLVEASGMLLQNSISEITAKGKYFVFVSTVSESEVFKVFGSKFMDSVGDILHTEDFSHKELYRLAEKIVEALKMRCGNNLSMNLNCDDSVLQNIVNNYKSTTGVDGMEAYVESYIYKPLAEYKLKNTVTNNQPLFLTASDGNLYAKLGDKNIKLSDLVPKKNIQKIDEIKEELKNIVGLESVKNYILSLEDNLKVQEMRAKAGYKTPGLSMHMIFTGNPGTGKTTIARIAARYLKALGVLSQGQLKEVTRADLVGQYVGHTAKLTNEVIKSALGGVLFIDEAYSLSRDKQDPFGQEAIDALVKGMEDNREDLVVILAGYKDEMENFLKSNPGLKSRFPNIIDFKDYTPEEMYEISLITARSKGYRISEDCREPLIKFYEKKQIKGKNDSGNGRLVRNVIEAAILNQSKRLLADHEAEMDLLQYEDFKFEEVGKFDLEASLSKIIGLERVKDFVRTQYRLLIAQEKRRKAGMSVDTSQALNMIFSGNPGTGKTTIARLMAEMFKEMGLLKSGHLVETDRSGLVAEYVGQTARKTEEVFKSALGGVLFIDEAYALSNDTGGFGKEGIDTLVKLIEDYRGEIVVILAGYKKEMEDFLKSNSGLQSRFPLKIDFPDYTEDELFRIAIKMIEEKGFVLDEGVDVLLKEQIFLLHKNSNAHSGNGRMVRNYVEEIMRRQSARIAMTDVASEEMNVIASEDIERKDRPREDFDLEKRLNEIIGLEEVKDYIRSLSARLKVQGARRKLGLVVDSTQTLHMIFKGNPGTGKTMVARTVAEVLYNIGVIKTDKLVETDRSGLVAGYVGQTAIKTREKFMEALDGVLFIDEAYSLSQGGTNDFGKEAIDTLVKLMDDYRDRIVVILAGYSEAMETFLSINAGLKSRFPNIIEFKDYTTEELMLIAEKLFKSRGYEITPSAKAKLREILNEARLEPQFGNGRYVRNLYERTVNNQAMRLGMDMDLTKADLITIVESDIERV